jgi:ethanolamine utilization protein EutA
MHDLEFEHLHVSAVDDTVNAVAWAADNVELTTVGIDIGSSTSHLMFARVHLQRLSAALSSRFVVVDRKILWQSPILLTPYRRDYTIDVDELAGFIGGCYNYAGIEREKVDSGAVILTGEAIKRKNARAIDELFAAQAGKFVCASAGHKLEARLAAHGSGAVAASKQRGIGLLHVDIGGGTTKLALINRGEIISVAAFAVGGRLIAQDASGSWTRIDASAHAVARELGLSIGPELLSDAATRQAIAHRLAALTVDQITGSPLDALGRELALTEPLDRTVPPTFLSFSGGVSEYIFGHETADYGDIARLLAAEIVAQLRERISIPVIEPRERIRATVIGASQFTVQVSGKTIYLSKSAVLPIRNIPVIHLSLDLADTIDVDRVTAEFARRASLLDCDPNSRIALAFAWTGAPEYPRLADMARAIMSFAAPRGHRDEVLVLMIDGDIARGLGRILTDELHLDGALVSIDGVQLRELDFVDIGELLDPPGVVPVVIKSLLFS